MSFGQNSVLSVGDWIKISVSENGVYKVDKKFFEKNASHFLSVSPDKVKIYHGNSKVLPQKNSDFRTLDLVELPVWVNENTWSESTFIAFYAEDPHVYTSQSHELNPYSNHNFYYITISETSSRKIEKIVSEEPQDAKEYLEYYIFEEKEHKNFLFSGRQWFGDFFNSSYLINPPIEDFYSDLTFRYSVLPLGRAPQFLSFSNKNEILKVDTLLGSLYNASDNLARYERVGNIKKGQILFPENSSEIKLNIRSNGVGSVGAHLDFWSLTYKRKLLFNEKKQIQYFGDFLHRSIRILNRKNTSSVWQIKSPHSYFETSFNGSINLQNDINSIILFDWNSLKTPKFVSILENQNIKNLPSPDLLVIYPESWKDEINKFVSWKKQNEDLEIIAVSIQSIYNEFSSGKVDVSAIRDFCKHLNQKSPLKYLLLIGDATYDYKNNLNINYVNFDELVPTYQSRESLEPIYSYSSDDYFAFLDDSEGEWPEGYSINNVWYSNTKHDHFMDIAVGRIPARSKEEFTRYFEKYKNYEKGQWQNRFLFVADNKDWNLHVKDAEKVEQMILTQGVETSKLYLDDYPIENGDVPSASKKLQDEINKGQFLITYLGHGSEEALTNEKLLGLGDILKFNDSSKPAIWFTGTCDFGKFDNPAKISGAELMMQTANNGAIGLLTTTRPVFASSNQKINEVFFQNMSQASTLGEWFMKTKNEAQQGEVNRNFTLLGDPSFVIPKWNKNVKIHLSSDTLKSYQKVDFFLESEEDGDLMLVLYDTPLPKKTLGNFQDSPSFPYTLNSERLTSTLVSIKNGKATGTLIIPKSHAKEGGLARMSYSLNGNFGAMSSIYLVNESPEIENFEKNAPTITKVKSDSLGFIYHLHDDTAVDQRTLVISINGKEVQDPLTYYDVATGLLKYNFPNSTKEGIYSVKISISDIYNNTKSVTFEFVVERADIEILESNLYPNPLTNYLNIKINHNRVGQSLKIGLKVIDLNGKTILDRTTECFTCESPYIWFIDKIDSGNITKGYYNLELKSIVEKTISSSRGTLIFWK